MESESNASVPSKDIALISKEITLAECWRGTKKFDIQK